MAELTVNEATTALITAVDELDGVDREVTIKFVEAAKEVVAEHQPADLDGIFDRVAEIVANENIRDDWPALVSRKLEHARLTAVDPLIRDLSTHTAEQLVDAVLQAKAGTSAVSHGMDPSTTKRFAAEDGRSYIVRRTPDGAEESVWEDELIAAKEALRSDSMTLLHEFHRLHEDVYRKTPLDQLVHAAINSVLAHRKKPVDPRAAQRT
jgi:hypothetical protein